MLKLTAGLALVTLVACMQCPDNEVCGTCCQAPTGETSCCPFHHGECCEDHLHCCPEGMLCQVKDSMCWNDTHSLPWVERTHVKQSSPAKSFRMIPSLPASESEITCPDGSYCPAEFSCLLMSTSYGCCPVAQGSVCSDGKHCCPKGHECSADSSSCVKPKEATGTVLCGDERSECPVDSTCCETEVDGQWACCPMPNAVSCDDKVHCCPEDSVCDVMNSKCVSLTNQELPMWAKFPARIRAEWEDHKPAVVTPEMTTEAEPTTDGQTTADLNQIAFLQTSSNSNVPCDGIVACPDNSTCCKTEEGGWACCPLPQAVCCDDFIHCCPAGMKCESATGKCEDSSSSVPWFEKVPVQPINSQISADTHDSNVPCDDTVACPDNSTCCKTQEGKWACCPLPQAVCCDDFIHCCPTGKKCNVAAGKCEDPSCSVPWLEHVPVQPISSQNEADTTSSPVSSNSNVPCDDTVACPDNSTCCKTQEGKWACCPLPQAVCCDDFIHCCPTGTKCDVAAGKCEDPSGSVPWFEKVPVQPINSQISDDTQDSNVPCDDTVACPDNSTCCKTQEGGWACCPLPQAVCCDDFIHCCPTGTKCDVAAGKCEDPSGSVPWFEKVPVQPINSQISADTQDSNVPCDDTVACPDNSTCCKTQEGGWACCPLPQAVCCDDFIHCCPTGTKCDVAAGKCEDPSGSVPWFEKVSAHPRAGQRSPTNVSCDSSHVCPESNTCCKNFDGGWSCCPMPEAVCCLDHFHCCPKGTTCDLISLTCDNGSFSMPMSLINPASAKKDHRQAQQEEVYEALGEVRKYNSRVPCDSQTSCPDHTTCCLITKTKKWGCCPLPNAVCCEDGEHCCPAHYECDVSKVSCIKKDVVIPWYNKIPAQSTPAAPSSDFSAVACDEQFSCSTGTTCCRLVTGKWGCCPLPEAVCCPDHEHCCPNGYTCDMDGLSCVKHLWLQVDRVPLTQLNGKKPQPISSAEDIECGAGYSCHGGETCCPTSESTWGCCPSQKAVCCDDMQHCCPNGYTCGEGGTCTKAPVLRWKSWRNWRVFFPQKK